LQVQDALRTLNDPDEIMRAAAGTLGRYLQANRIGFGWVDEIGGVFRVLCAYADGAPAVNGEFPLNVFGATHHARLRRGETVIYDDVLAEAGGAPEVWKKLGTRAHISVPMLRDGELRGTLFGSYMAPHAWTPEEVALIEAVAARMWDAAERGRAEAELRDSETRTRIAMAAGGLGTWELNIATGATIRSPRHDAIFGYETKREDWSTEIFLSHVVPDHRASVAAGLAQAMETGEDWQTEFRFIRVDGAERWINVRAKALLGPGGKPARLMGVIADITERKQAEARLLESEKLFRSFAQAMPHHVWTSQPGGEIDWYNDRVTEYSGLPMDVLLGANGWHHVVHPDDVQRVRDNRKEMAHGQPFDVEYQLRRADGMYRWFIRRAVPIHDEDGRIVRWLGTATDIHDQKMNEAALAALNASLEAQIRDRTAELMAAEAALRQSQKMEAVGQLTGGIAHDFNNMLQGIAGALELMERRIGQGRAAEAARYVTAARDGVTRAAALTHQLLAFSRRQALSPKQVDLNELIAGISGLIQQTAGPAITVEKSLDHGSLTVVCDPNQLENAILNLAINARDAMQPKPGRHRQRYRHGDVAGRAGTRFRAVLHHQTRGEGNRAGAEPGLRVRPAVKRRAGAAKPGGGRDIGAPVPPLRRWRCGAGNRGGARATAGRGCRRGARAAGRRRGGNPRLCDRNAAGTGAPGRGSPRRRRRAANAARAVGRRPQNRPADHRCRPAGRHERAPAGRSGAQYPAGPAGAGDHRLRRRYPGPGSAGAHDPAEKTVQRRPARRRRPGGPGQTMTPSAMAA
jgi:PAS domain S-box-containing protein